MTNPNCSYCSDEAKGFDEDGEFTCGATSCMPIEGFLPAIIEVSGEDDEADVPVSDQDLDWE